MPSSVRTALPEGFGIEIGNQRSEQPEHGLSRPGPGTGRRPQAVTCRRTAPRSPPCRHNKAHQGIPSPCRSCVSPDQVAQRSRLEGVNRDAGGLSSALDPAACTQGGVARGEGQVERHVLLQMKPDDACGEISWGQGN